MTHGDLVWVEWAVADTRRRARELTAGDESVEARLARKQAAEVDAWEKRRSGRQVRLWSARLEVRVAALDADDAQFLLAGHLRHPYHRIGDAPGLYTRSQPFALRGAIGLAEWDRLEGDYSRAAVAYRRDRRAFGDLQRAQVNDYVAALTAASARLLGIDNRAGTIERDVLPPDVALDRWCCRQTVLFLAGPLEEHARARAEELAATVVDHTGSPLAEVVGLDPDDGYVSMADGRWVHPVDSVGTFGATALWDDFDLADGAVGDPEALGLVLARAADQVRECYMREARLDALSSLPSQVVPESVPWL